QGHFDPGTKEFISGMVKIRTDIVGIKAVTFECSSCGSSFSSLPVKGTSIKCPSCGNVMVIE
nr:hypothetical protein [Candidatus Sigynarchaeota archaeon]